MVGSSIVVCRVGRGAGEVHNAQGGHGGGRPGAVKVLGSHAAPWAASAMATAGRAQQSGPACMHARMPVIMLARHQHCSVLQAAACARVPHLSRAHVEVGVGGLRGKRERGKQHRTAEGPRGQRAVPRLPCGPSCCEKLSKGAGWLQVMCAGRPAGRPAPMATPTSALPHCMARWHNPKSTMEGHAP